jgi:hypothetical protein
MMIAILSGSLMHWKCGREKRAVYDCVAVFVGWIVVVVGVDQDRFLFACPSLHMSIEN